MKKYLLTLLLPAVILVLPSCKNNDAVLDTPQKVFTRGKELLEDKKYEEAENMFKKIKLQYPASNYADSAQYYLGEVYFERKEFINAAFNYSLVERYYPASGLRKEARYKRAMCYYNLSPKFDRSHEYTKKAIVEFESYKTLYPGDSLFFDADKKISELRDKFARKDFEIGKLYQKIDEPLAAVIYYDFLINDYPDSGYLEEAMLGKIEMLMFMKRYEKARSAIEVYKKEYPKNRNLPAIQEYEKIIREESKK
jgi:outer membrane protein assembly factor BamD